MKASSWAWSWARVAAGSWARSQFLQGLRESFDFALGLGVAGPAVLLGDAQAAQFVLEAVAAAAPAGEPGGVDHSVVGQGGRRGAVGGDGGAEGGQRDLAGGHRAGGNRQGQPRVVVEPGHDLHLLPGGQLPVDEVGLPSLIWLLGHEPDVGRLRAFLRLGSDQASPGQVPADRGDRHRDLMMVLQVPGDGVRPGVQALPGQLLPQLGDQLDSLVADRGRGRSRPPRPRLERRLPLGPVPGQQRVNP